MPCYSCGTRQIDPEPGKPSPWHRGVLREHQVLICQDCYPAARADLSRCPRCDRAHLVKRLGQVECLDCHLTRDAEPHPHLTLPPAPASSPGTADSSLADEVERALARVLRTG